MARRVLKVDHGELLALVLEDSQVKNATLDILRPESVRVISYADVDTYARQVRRLSRLGYRIYGYGKQSMADF